MTLTQAQKERIINALLAQRENFGGSDSQYCKQFGLNGAVYSRLKNGERERVVGDALLVSIAAKLAVNFNSSLTWNIVKTQTFQYVTGQLALCQANQAAAILVDRTDIGKTVAAKEYARTNKNVFYIDCSQVKSKREFVRELARTVGVNGEGKIVDVIRETKYLLRNLEAPLVILDEAGDLSYDAFLEVKAYWNALEKYCGWYMIGADGLRAKIERHINHKTVGYAEIFSRFGKKYNSALPDTPADQKMFLRRDAELIALANLNDKTQVDAAIDLGFRRLERNVLKLNKINHPRPISEGEIGD